MARLVIGVSGLIGSGKDTVADYLKKRGFKKIIIGDLVREDAKKHNLKPTRRVLQDLQAQRIKEHGKYYWSQKASKKIKQSKSEKAVLGGIRHIEDVKEPKKEFKEKFIIVFVTASQKVRFKRLKNRRRTGDPKTFEQFKEQENRDKKMFEFDEIKKSADYIIDNSKNLDHFYEQIDKLIKKLRFSYFI